VPGIGLALGFDVRGGAPLASLRGRLAEPAGLGFTNAELSTKALAATRRLLERAPPG
jgi:hypothetical protein